MGNKILLADDSITIQKVIELTFSDEDFEVVTVGNGRLAIERATEVRPDVVLCDIIMPEKDGYEVCSFIKGHDELKHVPVLLLTGAFEPFDQQRAANVGADGYLAKPFEPQTLINKVRELLARAPSRPAVPMTQPLAPPAERAGDTVPSPAATVRVTPPPMPAVAPPFPPPAAAAPRPAPPPPAVLAAPPAPAAAAAPEVEPFFTTESPLQPEPAAVEEPLFVPEEIYVEESFEPLPPPAESQGGRTLEAETVGYDEAPEVFATPEPATPVVEPSFDEDFYAAGFAETAPAPIEVPSAEAVSVGSETVAFQPMEAFSFEQEAPVAPPPTLPEPEEPPVATFAEPEPAPAPALGAAEPWVAPAVPAAPEPPAAFAPPRRAAAHEFEPPPSRAAGVEPAGEFSFADVSVSEPEPPAAPPSQAAEVAVAPDQVAQIAQRVIAQISDKVVREVAWEVIPELAETLLKREIERLKEELESLKDG